jgi:hypothetical protein
VTRSRYLWEDRLPWLRPTWEFVTHEAAITELNGDLIPRASQREWLQGNLCQLGGLEPDPAGAWIKDPMSHSEVAELALLYFVLPLWLAAGFADYLCHRATSIELTSGYKESLIHLLMFAEVAVPLLAAIFLEINALVLATMIAGFIAHQLTALWDISFANDKRPIPPIEQQVHSFLELLPLMGILVVIIFNWQQFLSLFGLGPESARFGIALKPDPLPVTYVAAFLSAVLMFEILPYLEELIRGLRARKRSMTANGRGPL